MILAAILKWVNRAARRNQKTIASFAGNNLYYAAIALLFMLDPVGAGALLMIMGAIVILPLCSDPLRSVPKSRMTLWPLSGWNRRMLRLMSPWLNPMTWAVVALGVWKKETRGLAALAAGAVATGFIGPSLVPVTHRALVLPRFPTVLNQAIRKDIRQIVSTLDFWCAALIAGLAVVWRIAGTLPAAAHFPLTTVSMMALSTCALTLFGPDAGAGIRRYRLLPMSGWQMLLAKDVAYLAVAVVLSLPLSVRGAMGAAMVALAMGHASSVRFPGMQVRWRFRIGPSFAAGITQIIAMLMMASAVVYFSQWVLVGCVAVLGASVWRFGREIDAKWR